MPERQRKARVPIPPCPNPLHAGSRVTGAGVRKRKSGERHRYRCTPDGYPKHRFSIIITAESSTAPAYSPPPTCPTHAGSMVQRIGTYGTDDNKKQRYRCTPKTGERHDFTPELPRTFVHVGTEHCDHCEELRGVHHGDKSAARHTSWTGEQVFDVLADVAKGASYGKASRDARERARQDDHACAGRVTLPPYPRQSGAGTRGPAARSTGSSTLRMGPSRDRSTSRDRRSLVSRVTT